MQPNTAWSGKTKGNKLGYKIFIFLITNLGVKPAYFILHFVSFYYFLFGVKTNTYSYQYFREILGYSNWKSRTSVYKNYLIFGKSLIDRFAVMSNPKHPFTRHSNGIETLHKIDAQDKGAILISAHHGNWEIAGQFLNNLNSKVNIVLFDGERDEIKSLEENTKKERKFNIIRVSNDFSHLIAINNALKRKEFVCIHGDRFTDEEKSKTYLGNFMGKTAKFPVGPFAMAKKFGVPYAFVYGMKGDGYRYEFFAFEGKEENTSIESIINHYIKKLEYMIQCYPYQWYNYYPFWEFQKDSKQARKKQIEHGTTS